MSVSFSLVPSDLLVPGTYVEIEAQGPQGLATLPDRTLIIGNAISDGNGSHGVPYLMSSPADAAYYFGAGSSAFHMVEAFKAANPLDEVWAMSVADSGSAATWDVDASATAATEAGTLHFLLGGRSLKVSVAEDDTGTEIITAISGALPGDSNYAFTFSATGDSGSFTAKNTGAFTGDIPVVMNFFPNEKTPQGVSVDLTQSAAGATNPDVQAALDAIPNEWFTSIITCWSDASNLTALESYAADQWSPLVAKDTHIFAGRRDTYANLITYGDARNSKHSTVIGTGLSPTSPHIWAAALGGVEANEPDPGRPLTGLELPGCLPPASANRFSLAQRNLLLKSGISTFGIARDGSTLIERILTTYKTNSAGVADPTYRDIMVMRLLYALRYTTTVRLKSKFPRHKLASDSARPTPGQPIVQPKTIKSELISLYDQWSDQGWVEAAAAEQFQDELLVERNSSDPNRVDAVITPDLINALFVTALVLNFKV